MTLLPYSVNVSRGCAQGLSVTKAIEVQDVEALAKEHWWNQVARNSSFNDSNINLFRSK